MKQLEEIKARASAATPGPWKAQRGGDFQSVRLHDGSLWIDVVDGSWQRPPFGEWIDSPDIDFIESARADIPRLIAALEAAEEILKWLDMVEEVHPSSAPAGSLNVSAAGTAAVIRKVIKTALEGA
jgi:predicted RNA methylase